jgi:hypothetical protein
MAQSGMSYEQLTEMNIQVRVRYNNIFVDGAKLSIFAEGNWAVTCIDEDDIVTYKPYLSINGEQKPEWEAYKYYDWWGARQNTRSWPDGTLHPPFYYYPKHDVKMPAQHGIAQESTITVSGRLFGYRYSENSVGRRQTGCQNRSQFGAFKCSSSLQHRTPIHFRQRIGLDFPQLG